MPTNSTSFKEGGEPFRPQYHFTPRANWINDPNGLVYFEGEYHLFFQYNPSGMQWGNICWGHAVSSDLLHWRELAIAIPETDQMIFSGSVIVDRENVAGLGTGTAPALIAFFTAFNPRTLIQSQHVAYSHDRGRSFKHYSGNPVIDLEHKDFRDPKVFYHAKSRAWIMVVALARNHQVQFYRSQNLLAWTLASEFGPAGSTSGQWECPDLICVPIEGQPGDFAWVLKIDIDTGFLDGGSGAQYFVGDFDGYRFAIDPGHGSPGGDIVDYGPDFYAAVTWSDLPSGAIHPIWIGWQSNHQSGKKYPTNPWRGAMSLPRRLFLFQESGRFKLGQDPIDIPEDSLRDRHTVADCTLLASQSMSIAPVGVAWRASVEFSGDQNAQIRLSLMDGDMPLVSLAADGGAESLMFERMAGNGSPIEGFARRSATRLPDRKKVTIELFFDGSLLEVFVDVGRRVYSACIFPAVPPHILLVNEGSSSVRIQRLQTAVIKTLIQRE